MPYTTLYIKQGTLWNYVLYYLDPFSVPVNLIGVTARMQIRATRSSSAVLLELSTANGRISLGNTLSNAGKITLTLQAADTIGLLWTSGVFDLELDFGAGRIERICGGAIDLSLEVTRGP